MGHARSRRGMVSASSGVIAASVGPAAPGEEPVSCPPRARANPVRAIDRLLPNGRSEVLELDILHEVVTEARHQSFEFVFERVP